MKYKAFVFDLDGVLVFTDQLHYKAWKKLANKLQIEFDDEINNRLRGVGRMESLDIILEKSTRKFSMQEKEELAEEKNNTYVSLISSMNEKDVSDDVRNTLVELKRKGFKLAIGSSSKNAKLILNQTKLIDYFDVISDGTNIQESKPNPEVFLKAAEYLDIDAKDCFAVDDANAGIDAANAAGMCSVGIGEAASYNRCSRSISTFSDLLYLV